MDRKNDFIFSLILIAAVSFLFLYNYVGPFFFSSVQPSNKVDSKPTAKIVLSDPEWRRKLYPQQYEVLRRKTTEPAFSGKYVTTVEEGTYTCAGCGLPLFSSKDKYDAKTGWATFTQSIDANALWYSEEHMGQSKGLKIFCSRCDSFIGTLFYDGQGPKMERYSINSLALNFLPKKK